MQGSSVQHSWSAKNDQARISRFSKNLHGWKFEDTNRFGKTWFYRMNSLMACIYLGLKKHVSHQSFHRRWLLPDKASHYSLQVLVNKAGPDEMAQQEQYPMLQWAMYSRFLTMGLMGPCCSMIHDAVLPLGLKSCKVLHFNHVIIIVDSQVAGLGSLWPYAQCFPCV